MAFSDLRLLVILVVAVQLVKAPLPSFFPVCFRDDPDISECIIRGVKLLQPKLITGDLGEGFVIPVTDPFDIPKLTFGTERDFKTILTKMQLRGMSNFEVVKLKFDVKKLKMSMILSFPQLSFTANYRIILRLFGSPMQSKGQMFQKIENTKVGVRITANEYIKDGEKYLRLDPLFFKILQSDVKVLTLTNLFPNTLLIGPLVRSYLAESKDFITRAIYPDFEKTFSQTYTILVNELLTRATFDELFPS